MGSRKVLIIEDEPEIQTILAMSLSYGGHFEVIIAGDGVEGISMALRELPDLILLDAYMPRMDGYATCRKIKRDPRLRDIPVIFLTAKTDQKEIERAMRCGANGYLTKPFDPLTLADQVTSIVPPP